MFRRVAMSPLLNRAKKTLKHRLHRKWLSDKDRFSMSKTGEEPMNQWITRGRVQTLLKELERMRNLNRHTIKFNPELMSKFADASEEYSELCTHRLFVDHQEFIDNFKSMDEVKLEAKTLPLALQKDLTRDADQFEPPGQMEFFDKFHSQMERFLPKKLSDNWMIVSNVKKFLDKGLDDKSESDE